MTNAIVNAREALQASQEKMKLAGAPLIGAIVTYNVTLRGVERSVLRRAFEKAGFGVQARACIASPSADQALRMAPTRLGPPKGLAIKPFTLTDNAVYSVGIYERDPDLPAEEPSEKGDPLLCGARVRIENGLAVAMPPEDQTDGFSFSMSYARALALRANNLVRFAETSDVTGTLDAILIVMHGVKQCDHGRGHLILERYVAPWSTLTDALVPFGLDPRMVTLWGLPDHIATAATTAKDSFSEKILELRLKLQVAAGKTGKNGKGPRGDSMGRAIEECVKVVNEANMYQSILGDLSAAIKADVAAVQKHFATLANGGHVAYGGADVDAPIMGEAQILQTPPETIKTLSVVKHLSDGTVQIPSSSLTPEA